MFSSSSFPSSLKVSGHSFLASSFRVVVEGNSHERSVNILERIRRSPARLPYNERGKKPAKKSKASIGNQLMEVLSARDETKWTRFRRKATDGGCIGNNRDDSAIIFWLSVRTLQIFASVLAIKLNGETFNFILFFNGFYNLLESCS